MIHIRVKPEDTTMTPAECGAVGQTTVSEAWGFYGPGGAGRGQICTACVKARELRRGSHVWNGIRGAFGGVL